jgi:hypothetical protein
MQISMIVAHCYGAEILGWGIHASWGLSDGSEQFVLLSGLVLGSVFARKRFGGVGAAARDMLARALRLWRTHLVVFVGLGVLVVAAEHLLATGEAGPLGWSLFAAKPHEALLGAALLLHQPMHMGILPVFLVGMLLLPGFLWLAERTGAWALALPWGLWLAVQTVGLRLPEWGGTTAFFNLLAWQALFLTGAWLGRATLLTGRAVPATPWLLGPALVVLAFGIWVRLWEQGWVPGPDGGFWLWPDRAELLYFLFEKTDLPALRMLHALALAYAVACLVPRELALFRTGFGRVMAAIGRNSLPVFCVGLFTTYLAGLAIRMAGGAAWVELVAVPAAIALAWVQATWLEGRRAPRGARGSAGATP